MTSPTAYRCGSAVRIRRVDLHEPLLDLGARRLEADVVRVRAPDRWRPASARRAARPGASPSLPTIRQTPLLVGADRRRVEARVVMTFMPRRWKRALAAPWRHRRPRAATTVGQVLEQRHLDARVVVEAGELDADGAAADDDDALGQRVAGGGRLVAGDDRLAVGHEAGQRLDPLTRWRGSRRWRRATRSPSGLPFSSSVLTRTFLPPCSVPRPRMCSTLFFLTRLVEALGQPVDDLVAPLGDVGVVER